MASLTFVRRDQLQNHLEEFCLNRQVSTDKSDLKKGGVWTSDGYHHFVFDNFLSTGRIFILFNIGFGSTLIRS